MNKAIVVALAALMAFAGSAVAQTESGTILAGLPGTDFTGGVTYNAYANGGIVLNGVDGWIINLDANLSEFSLTGDAGVIGVCDLDIAFFDANGGDLGYDGNGGVGIGTVECNEGGGRTGGDAEIPAGAAVAIISAYVGFNTNFVFEAE